MSRNLNYDQIQFDTGFSPGYSGTILPGSTAYCSLSKSFSLFVQEFVTDLYSFRYNRFNFFEDVSFQSKKLDSGLYSRTLIKGSNNFSLKDIGDFKLAENEFSLIWSHQSECSSFYAKETQYDTIDLHYSAAFVEKATDSFPELRGMLDNSETLLLTGSPCFTSPLMKDIVTQMLNCPFQEHRSRFYYDLKVREYFFLMLQQVFSAKSIDCVFSEYEVAQLETARDIILKDLSQKNHTITELSKIVGLNEFKLKAGFRQLFGEGVFECLQSRRLDKAKELLLTTDRPIKEICAAVGYPRITNFITAFRKRFGYTPGSIRRT